MVVANLRLVKKICAEGTRIVVKVVTSINLMDNSPVSYSVRHQRPTLERHKILIASRENVDNQTPRNTSFTHWHVNVYL